MVLISVYTILIYQLACYQRMWYLVRRTKELTHTHTYTTTRFPDCKPRLSSSTKQILKTKLQAICQFTRRARATKASVIDLPSRQKDSQIHLLIQQTCQADKPTDKPTSVIWWTFQEQTERYIDLPTSAVGFPNRIRHSVSLFRTRY